LKLLKIKSARLLGDPNGRLALVGLRAIDMMQSTYIKNICLSTEKLQKNFLTKNQNNIIRLFGFFRAIDMRNSYQNQNFNSINQDKTWRSV
jgi:hypothetical protein